MLPEARAKSYNWTPRPHQLMMYHYDNLIKYDEEHSVFVANHTWHRRAGKSLTGSNTITKKASEILGEDRIYKIRGDVDSAYPKIAYLAETKENARNIIWSMLKDSLSVFNGNKPDNNRLSITIPRPHLGDVLEVRLMSLRDHNKIRGEKYRYIHIDEGQLMTEDALKYSIMATLTDSMGVLQTTGTATSVGYYANYIKGCIERGTFCSVVPITMTQWKTPQEQALMRKEFGEFAFEQEYMCNFNVSTSSAFWNMRLNNLESDKDRFFRAVPRPGRSKVLAVDIGVGKGFAAWSAEVDSHGLNIDILDFYTGYEVLSELRDDLVESNMFPDVVILPHDRKQKRLETHAPRNTEKVFKEVFPQSKIIPLKKPANNQKFMQIQNVTENLGMLSFPPEDAETDAHVGLSHLKTYRRKQDRTGAVLDTVVKDGKDHAGDALIHLFEGLKVSSGRVLKIPKYHVGDYQLQSVGRTGNMELLLPSKGSIRDIYG